LTRTVLGGGSIFDGLDGRLYAGELALESDRIVAVGSGLEGDSYVDCAGMTLVPGLIDCHVHVTIPSVDLAMLVDQPLSYRFLLAARIMEQTLLAGITTARDGGGADVGLKMAQRDGLIRGPRLHVSIGMISQIGGHADEWHLSGATVAALFLKHVNAPASVVNGPDDMRRVARELIRAGADTLKVATSGGVLSPTSRPHQSHLDEDELECLSREAERADVPVMAHAHSAAGIKSAVKAGFRSVEHGSYLDDEAIEMMLSAGTWLVPTLSASHHMRSLLAADLPMPAKTRSAVEEVAVAHFDSARRAIAAGVRIAMGSDAGVSQHGANLTELSLLVACGMSPSAALLSATSSASRLLRIDSEAGTLEPGKRADITVVEGNALDFPIRPDRIRAVYQDGRVHEPIVETGSLHRAASGGGRKGL